MADLPDPIRLYQGSTLANLVTERLEQKIGTGDLQPGERLNEVALATELGVSRGPIRESIRILERKGLVTVVANRGAFVRRIDRNDMVDLYLLRGVVTGLACLVLGEGLLGKATLRRRIVGTLIGTIAFRLLVAAAVRAGLPPDALKLATALFVLAALGVPAALTYLRRREPTQAGLASLRQRIDRPPADR